LVVNVTIVPAVKFGMVLVHVLLNPHVQKQTKSLEKNAPLHVQLVMVTRLLMQIKMIVLIHQPTMEQMPVLVRSSLDNKDVQNVTMVKLQV